MKANEQFLNKKVIAKIGENPMLLKVTSIPEGSQVLLTGIDIGRGRGWDPEKKKYTGYSTPGNWTRGQNYGFGISHTFHINQIVK